MKSKTLEEVSKCWEDANYFSPSKRECIPNQRLYTQSRDTKHKFENRDGENTLLSSIVLRITSFSSRCLVYCRIEETKLIYMVKDLPQDNNPKPS